jgi:hypothetical protein
VPVVHLAGHVRELVVLHEHEPPLPTVELVRVDQRVARVGRRIDVDVRYDSTTMQVRELAPVR